ncbi:MAG: hypothetical protein ACK5P7_10045 [Bdellovibrio sp.]
MKALLIMITSLLLLAPSAQADKPAVHGMVLFGDKINYVSHLPMFHAPHDYQVILQVRLSQKTRCGGLTLQNFEAAKAQGQTEFTLAPEPMDLTKIISGEKTSFQANLYQGHFEKNGKDLGRLTVEILKTIVSNKLDPEQAEQNQYVLFGEKSEYFAAHLINGKPSFDSILSVSKPYKLQFPHCRTRVCADPLPIAIGDANLPQTVFTSPFPQNQPSMGEQIGSFGVMADVIKIIYFEEQELAH